MLFNLGNRSQSAAVKVWFAHGGCTGADRRLLNGLRVKGLLLGAGRPGDVWPPVGGLAAAGRSGAVARSLRVLASASVRTIASSAAITVAATALPRWER